MKGHYRFFAIQMQEAIRSDRCEHVWAEILNVRGESMTRTIEALDAGGFADEALSLECARNRDVWEQYARETFLPHSKLYPADKLRFLQYVTPRTRAWWTMHRKTGAILL